MRLGMTPIPTPHIQFVARSLEGRILLVFRLRRPGVRQMTSGLVQWRRPIRLVVRTVHQRRRRSRAHLVIRQGGILGMVDKNTKAVRMVRMRRMMVMFSRRAIMGQGASSRYLNI
jgi:hypothetical protein